MKESQEPPKEDEPVNESAAQIHIRDIFFNWPITVISVKNFIKQKLENNK